MTRRLSFVLTLIATTSLLSAGAGAQTSDPSTGPLKVEPLESGFVVAPDARFTKLGDDFATLAGVYGGWLTDRRLLVGAGGYWLANRDDDFRMQYGGFVSRWTFGAHRTVGVSAGGLIGFGDATLGKRYGDLFGAVPTGLERSGRDGRFSARRHASPFLNADTLLRVNESYFIAEPQVNALVNLTRWMRLDAGVAYRLIGGAELLEDDLRGISGSIALQFGGR